MLLIQASRIKKSYGPRTILDFEALEVYQGDKIGIIGANGTGKSTLLGLLSGEIASDQGVITRSSAPAFIRQFGEAAAARSGGEQAKQEILAETSRSFEVLFADEPTANLDLQGQRWVLQKLMQAKTLLLVSHDKDLLNAVCTRIVEVKEGSLVHYIGNYADYEAAVQMKRQQQGLAADEYRKQKAQLKRALEKKQRKAAGVSRAPTRMGNSEARLGRDKIASKQKKVEREATIIKRRLERLEPVAQEKELPALRLDFSLTSPPGNRRVITGEAVSFAYGKQPVLTDASFVVERGARVALEGANGAGKTTLLRLIWEGHPGIQKVPKLKLGWLRQDFSNLDPQRSVLDHARMESVQDLSTVRSALAGLLFRGDDVYKPAAVLSGGEKIRLSLAMLLTSNCNALLLDEPTNYLDLLSLDAVARVLCQYPGTIVFVSHQKDFVKQVATHRLRVAEGRVYSLEQHPQLDTNHRTNAQKLLLEVKFSQILAELSSAPPDRKDVLEQEYVKIMQNLREFSL